MVKMLEALESGTSSESESDSPDESYSKDSSNTSPNKSSTNEVSKSGSDVPFTKDKVSSTEDSDKEKPENSKTNVVSKNQCTELQDIDENSNSSDIPLIKLIPTKEKVSGEVYKTEGIINSESFSDSSQDNASNIDNIFNKKKEVKPLIDSDTKEEKLRNSKTNGFSKKQCTELQDIDENSNSSDTPLAKLITTKEKVKLSDQTSKHKNLTSNSETEGKQKSSYCDPSMNTPSVLPLEKDSGVQVAVSKSITKKSQLTKKKNEELDTKQNIKEKKSGKSDNTWPQTKSSKIKKKLEISSDENDSDGNVRVDEKNSSKNEEECKISDSASKSFSSEDDPTVVRQSPAANQNRPGPASSKKKSAKKIQSINAQTEEFKKETNVKRRKCNKSDSSQLQLSKTKRKLEISSDDNDSDGTVSMDERNSPQNQDECKISDSASKNFFSDNNTKARKRSPISNQKRPGPASSKKKSTMKIQSNSKQPAELEKKTNLKRKRSGESDSSQLQLSKTKRKLEISSDDNDSDGNMSMDEKNSTENEDECKISGSASKSFLSNNNTKAGNRSPVSNQKRPGPASSKKKTTMKIQSNNEQPDELEKKADLKRKRSDESDSSLLQLSKTKRKLEISSYDNDSDGNVSMDERNSTKNEEECKISNSASKSFSSDNGVKTETRISTSEKNRPSSTKKDPITDGNSAKLSDTTNKKLDDSDILERLEYASDGSDDSSEESDDSSEESDADEKLQEKPRKELTNSDSIKTQEKSKVSQKNGRKLAPKKKPAAKNAVSESDDDCSDEAKPMKDSKSSEKKNKSEVIESSSSNSSDDSNSNSPSEKNKKVAKKPEKLPKSDSKKETGKKIGDNPRIARLQRYLKEAGIRVQNYKTLWHGCKSEKARAEKLLELLRERGLKGKPSISECRKLKRRNEKEKEISELNTSNIISTNGRSRRGTASLFASRCAPSLDNSTNEEPSRQKSPEFKKVFGRLRAIVDSEDSD